MISRSEISISFVAIALVFVATLNGQETLGPLMRSERPNLLADAEMAHLEVAPAFDDLDEVNIDTGAFWNSMWASYFLRDKTVYLLEPSYYAISVPTAKWTLVRTDEGSLPSGQATIPINSTYRLIEQPPSEVMSDSGRGLDATVEVISDRRESDRRTIVVRVTNSGDSTWLPNDVAIGGVRMAGSLVDEDGTVVVLDQLRAGFDTTSVVAPGWSVTAVISISEGELGGRTLVLQTIAENIARFGESVSILAVAP